MVLRKFAQHAQPTVAVLLKREVTKAEDPDALVVDAWSEGLLVGSLMIMSCITIANMRHGVWLHRLILIELVVSISAGFGIFTNPPVYGYYTAITSMMLYICYTLHNVIAWMKIKPFLSQKVSRFYIVTVALATPYWVVNTYANFAYKLNINDLFEKTRPLEFIFRDPWWIFTTVALFWNIKRRYEFKLMEILRISPRFCILLLAMILSICFMVVDIISVVRVLKSALPVGVNPFWRLSFIFKCLTDSVILDDFKMALDRLSEKMVARLRSNLGTINSPQSNAELIRHRTVSVPYSEGKARWNHVDHIDRVDRYDHADGPQLGPMLGVEEPEAALQGSSRRRKIGD